jgi:hypothetical protein
MNLIPAVVSAKVALTILKTKKHSPKIMFGAGVVGVVATVVTASQATLKGVGIIEEHKALKAGLEGIEESERYTHEDLVKDKALLLAQTSIKLVRTYAVPVCIGVASIGLLAGAHVVLTKRNAGLTAAYAAIDKAFREYRGRVVEKVGVEQEREIYADVREEKFTTVDANGKQKQVIKKVSQGGGAGYRALFSEIVAGDGYPNPNWHDLPEIRVMFLRSIERQVNDKLRASGFVFLNEVLELLGLQRTKEGAQVGWVLDSPVGDGFIDFGIFGDDELGVLYDFSTGREDAIWLRFNAQGNILDLI